MKMFAASPGLPVENVTNNTSIKQHRCQRYFRQKQHYIWTQSRPTRILARPMTILKKTALKSRLKLEYYNRCGRRIPTGRR